MKMYRLIFPALIALLAGGVAALAAFPYTSLFSPQTGDVPFYGPLGGYYTKVVPSTGFTLTFDNNQAFMQLRPSGTLAAGYVTFAPNPPDGRRACTFSTQTVTLFYPTANAGQTVNDAVTTLLANAGVCYLYSLSNTTWDRD